MYEDVQGDIWVGSKGLCVLRDLQCTSFQCPTGKLGSGILSLCQDRHGHIWTRQPDGLYSFAGNAFVPFLDRRIDNSWPYFVYPADDGGLWLNNRNRLYYFDGGRFVDESATFGLASNESVNSIVEDKHNAVWLGTSNGLVRKLGNRLTRLTAKDGAPSGRITLLYADPDGCLWVGTDRSVSQLSSGRFVTYTAQDGLPTVPIIAAVKASDGALWIGSWGEGLYRLLDGKIAHIGVRDGLYAGSIHAILEDDSKNLWIGSGRGIFRVSLAQLDRCADHRAQSVECVPFGPDDGASGDATAQGYQPVAWRAHDGNFWFSGSSLVLARQRPINTRRCPVYIEDIHADGQPVSPLHRNTVAPGTRLIQVQYTALDFSGPQKLKFRYKLVGFDPTWTDAGTRRTAYFTNLPPGSYDFRVIACNSDGIWSQAGASVRFKVLPYFYQTVGFKVLLIVPTVLIICLCIQAYVYQLRLRNRLLEQRVTERTSELQLANEQLHSMHKAALERNDELEKMQLELEAQQ